MQLELDIPCPKCKRKFKERVANVRPGNHKTCPNCGADIAYEGDDVSGLQRSLDKLEQTFQNFNRKHGSK